MNLNHGHDQSFTRPLSVGLSVTISVHAFEIPIVAVSNITTNLLDYVTLNA